MQYYCISFSHSLAVTVISRVSAADRCQSGKLSRARILYCHDFILSVLQFEWAKSYRVILCQPNFQMSSVFSLATLHVTQNSFVYILRIVRAEIEEKLVVELPKCYVSYVVWCEVLTS